MRSNAARWAVLCACLSWLLAERARAADESSRAVSGRVVDEAGRAIECATLGWFWSGNGIPRDEDGTPWPTDEAGYRKKIAEQGANPLSGQVGTMEPFWTEPSATTDAQGRFSLAADSNSHVLLAMDRPRQRGALLVVDEKQRELAEPVVIRGLVRVHGTMACSGPQKKPQWTNVYVDVEPDLVRRPLDSFRILQCSSHDADFSFLVPPGTYALEVYSTGPEAHVKDGIRLALDGRQTDKDLGAVELTTESIFLASRIQQWEAKGGRGDFKKHFGRTPPPWFIADARGVGRDAQLADFRGKWVVLEFWNLSCTVCLKRDLPAWTKFYQQHRDQRDRFEILAICVDVDENLDSIAQVEKQLGPIVKYVWNGQDLPFPLLLDSRLKTWQSFGLDFMAKTLLIDPQGNLTDVEGHQEVFERLTQEIEAKR